MMTVGLYPVYVCGSFNLSYLYDDGPAMFPLINYEVLVISYYV